MSHYGLRDVTSLGPEVTEACHLKFNLVRNGYQNPEGEKGNTNPYLDREWQRDVENTREILAESGCESEYVARDMDADLIIVITNRGIPEAAQDWLTGLSLGIIPSWKTARGAQEFRFENRPAWRFKTYRVDGIAFSHLLLAPLSIAQFAAHETGLRRMGDAAYAKALSEFVRKEYGR